MAEPWGGIVPPVDVEVDDARAETAAAQRAPTGAPPEKPTAEERLARGAEQTQDAIEQLLELERQRNTPAQLHTLTFNGSVKGYVIRNSHPPVALSVGIVNPTSLTIYLGLDGGRAAPNSHAFSVPPESAMVIPVAVDKLDVGVDPAALEANSATIFLLRFQRVQPFSLGAM